MHCDRVFAILTRGPFPSGEVTDVAVELHLAHCVSCRRLAEALRPTDATPHETVEPADALALPGYRGDHPEWSTDRVRSCQRIAPPAVVPVQVPFRREQRGRSARLRIARTIGFVLLGIAVGAAWTTIAKPEGETIQSRKVVLAGLGGNHASTEMQQQAILLERMELPLVCRKFDGERFLPLSDDPRVPLYLAAPAPTFESQCCTQCHSAGGKSHLSKPARNKVIQSCTICHADDSGPQ